MLFRKFTFTVERKTDLRGESVGNITKLLLQDRQDSRGQWQRGSELFTGNVKKIVLKILT